MNTYIVDAFTEVPFRGNPAGVCRVTEPLAESRMLQIAQELNLSETAFVEPLGASGDRFTIRYFSPKMEIPLCGHATLASARVLFDESILTQVEFVTGSGLVLSVKRSGRKLVMRLPRYALGPAEIPEGMLAALGVNAAKHVAYADLRILMLVLDDPAQLRGLTPDFAALRATHDAIHGVVVTSLGDSAEYDFQSRYFWPWSGTDEDPVTGGTHTFLAPYWADKLDRTRLRAHQASKRSGSMDLTVERDQVRIEAGATIVLRGELCVETNP